MRMSRVSPSVLGLLCACLALDLASAAPPPWAPAHGWRAKNDPFYVGYAGRQWSEDYGVTAGRCNTDSVLAAIGATAGAVIGNRAAREEHRTVATIVGAVVGGVVGDAIGRKIDDGDRACTGHALELARVGQKVRWSNPETGVTYTVRPTRDLADRCREFEFRAGAGRTSAPVTLTGCAGTDGQWVLRS